MNGKTFVTAIVSCAVAASTSSAALAQTIPQTFIPGRTPIGMVASTSLSVPAVLAGGETSILVHYTIGDREYLRAGAPVLVYVDLLSPTGALIRRSDPAIVVPRGAAPIQTSVIRYAVPVDAGGRYLVRVMLCAASGGSIAHGAPVPLLVAAGPDPQPAVRTEFRASGSIEVGPGAAGTTFNPGLATALQWPTYSLAVTGLYDPVSHRADPVLTLASGSPGAIQSPAQPETAQPAGSHAPESGAPAPAPAASFKDTLGRGTAALPAVLGDGMTLRGIDATRSTGPWVLHGAYGFNQLGAARTAGERASLLDVAHTLGAGHIRVAAMSRDDDPVTTVSNDADPGAIRATATALELSQALSHHFTLNLTGARSNASSLVKSASASDASDRATFAYTAGTTHASLDYHNAGDGFAVGAGPGATSDRAGWMSSLGFNLSPATALALAASREETRSVATRQTDASATVTFTLSPQSQAQLSLKRDTQRSATSRATNDQLNATFSAAAWGGQLALNATVFGLNDALQPQNATSTRTATLQYTRQSNAHTLAVGFTGTALTGFAGNAQTGESVTYGFPVGGHVVNGAFLHGFELQLALTNAVSSAPAAVTRDAALSAIVSYHLTPHVALGLHSEVHRRSGPPGLNGAVGANGAPSPDSALRLRLDVTQ